MARYEVPPDPRDPNEKRPSSPRYGEQEPMPWRYFALGLIVTLVSIVMALAVARAFLLRPPLQNAESGPVGPDLIILTAPPTAVPTETSVVPTPTVVPTFTPIPTPDNAIAPEEVTVGYYAQVSGTGEAGVTIRGGPSTSNANLTIAAEGDVLLVIGGPESANDLLWWNVELEDGTQGWAAGLYLVPAAAP